MGSSDDISRSGEAWPSLPLAEWEDTRATLHMWTQIAGKIRLKLSPMQNHWWQTALYVTSRGLSTSPIPYGNQVFEICFDFIDHHLIVQSSAGATENLPLAPCSVADFYKEVMALLKSMGIAVAIYSTPVEVPNPIPFEQDTLHASYDAEYANRFWRVLVQADRVFKEFRGRFLGKCSPVNFYWGSFDLAVTRFSGRPAPPRPGADRVTREAYSHEVISCGFWPGGGDVKGPAFYCYAAPAPAEFDKQPVLPASSFFSGELGEFLLMYDDLRNSERPEQDLLDFLQSTYEAGATLANWDRPALEWKPVD